MDRMPNRICGAIVRWIHPKHGRVSESARMTRPGKLGPIMSDTRSLTSFWCPRHLTAEATHARSPVKRLRPSAGSLVDFALIFPN
jgi:hypothetical protein